jgi:phosphomannomutase
VAAVEESAHYYITLAREGSMVATESTLLIVLLFLKTWREDKQRFLDLLALQNSVARKREWGYTYANESQRTEALMRVEKTFQAKGYEAVNTQVDTSPLGSTLLRIGVAGESSMWACISQRASESEEGIARWSVVASDAYVLAHCVDTIDTIAAQGAVGSYQG